MPYYGLVAAIYGDGVPVRLANDRFEQFQTSLKRHQFNMRYAMAVERRSGLLQSFQAGIVANGGGRANCSVALTMAGATSAASIYYFPKSDIAATAIASRAIDCGSARGYGAIETVTATELMVDEIAAELGLDPIEFRLRNVLKTGMKTTQGAVPDGIQRGEAVLQKARAHALWTEPFRSQDGLRRRASGQILRGRLRCDPASLRHRSRSKFCEDRDRPGREHRAVAHRHGDRHGYFLGPGRRVRALARTPGRSRRPRGHRLARAARRNKRRSAHDQPERAGSSGREPALDPGLCVSASSASNSSYYFTHTTREAARIVFLHGLWPAALAIWGEAGRSLRPSPRARAGAMACSRLPKADHWPLARLAAEAHARGLVTGATVHAFNRWQWAEADFDWLTALCCACRWTGCRALAPWRWRVRPMLSLLDRRAVFFPPTAQQQRHGVGYNGDRRPR